MIPLYTRALFLPPLLLALLSLSGCLQQNPQPPAADLTIPLPVEHAVVNGLAMTIDKEGGELVYKLTCTKTQQYIFVAVLIGDEEGKQTTEIYKNTDVNCGSGDQTVTQAPLFDDIKAEAGKTVTIFLQAWTEGREGRQNAWRYTISDTGELVGHPPPPAR